MIIHIYTYILECQGDADAGGGRLLRSLHKIMIICMQIMIIQIYTYNDNRYIYIHTTYILYILYIENDNVYANNDHTDIYI